ncbi:hypothetical protein GTO91_04805 [Heliobacterium undosum]|uniref:Uncharacterized protein n=1 Tax=Heliomicrobium undosum TaxID=121734 RepID=A0A845L383_9FIRM|nr:hypothetical protein [Heliomicrobium undosum]MZP29030.1 hypothetical protein [Heliomicrobium undosum]
MFSLGAFSVKWMLQGARGTPDDQKPAFRDRVITQVLERAKQPDGAYLDRFQRINVSAWK